MIRFGVGVVGCGLIGKRRAAVAAATPASRCVAVTDASPAIARSVASETHAEAVGDWRAIVARDDVDIVVVATPNAFLAEVGIAAMEAGKHVLIEKPMGRNLEEAMRLAESARSTGRVLKIGFNHRYHPAIARAHEALERGDIGRIINVRCRYGHGGRAGYELEWRGSREMAGGGELTDQGVHVTDLLHWFAGVPVEAFGMVQTAVWPLGDLEDNGFGLFRFEGGAIASFHTSWTQWKNLFSLEVFGERGALQMEGLGRSYGPERLIIHRRRAEGGAPDTQEEEFPGEDISWQLEWDDFLGGIDGRPMLGNAADGVISMRMLDALYRSASQKSMVSV